MSIVIGSFLVILGTHILLGERVERLSWNLWQTILATLVVISVSISVGLFLHTLLPIAFSTLIMATVLQRKFMFKNIKQ